MAYRDPYYWSGDIMRTQAQQKALGQTTGLNPTALSNVIASDYSAQAEETRANQNYELAVRRENLMESSAAAQTEIAKSKQTQQTASSIGSGLMNAPLTYKSYMDLFSKPKPETTSTPTSTPALSTSPTGEVAPIGGTGVDVGGSGEIGANFTQAIGTGPEAEEGMLQVGTQVGAQLGTQLGAQLGVEAGASLGPTVGEGVELGLEAAGNTGLATSIGEGIAAAWTWIVSLVTWVLCSELVRQGLLKKEIVEQEWSYVKTFLTSEEYWGYRLIADPLVQLMQKSRKFTLCIAPFIRAFAYEMASRVNPEIKGSHLGSFILWAGLPLCKMVYILKYRTKGNIFRVFHRGLCPFVK